MSIGSINDFDNEEPSTLPPRLPPPPEFPDGEFTPEEQLARQPPPRDPRPAPRIHDPSPPGYTPVSALGGETSDLSLLPARFEQFATKTEDALKTLAEGMKLLNESVLPLLALQGKRIDEGHRETIALANRVDAEGKRNDERNDRQDARLDAVEAALAALRNPAPTKAQRPKKRAGRKTVR